MNFIKAKITLPSAVASVINRDSGGGGGGGGGSGSSSDSGGSSRPEDSNPAAPAGSATAQGSSGGGSGSENAATSLMQRLRKKISTTSLLGRSSVEEPLVDIDSAPPPPAASSGQDGVRRSGSGLGGSGAPARPPVPAPRATSGAAPPALTICLDEAGAAGDACDAVKEFSFANNGDGAGQRPALLPTPSGNLIKFASDRDLTRAAAVAAAATAASTLASGCSNCDDEPTVDDGAESDASSEPQYSRDSAARSGSMHSIDSAEVTTDDSAYDDMVAFSKEFLSKIFQEEPTTEQEKEKLEDLIKNGLFRQLLARNLEEMTAESGKVSERVFYQLVQYFAMVLDKCDVEDDFSPAKALMQVCFRICYEDEDSNGKPRKFFLYTYLKAQPIWQSMRFWNAAFFETIQTERMRLTANESSVEQQDDKSDEAKLQESIVYGHLGTYTCNMCAVGLKKEWCLEFLRKQAYLAGLDEERINMLRENMERL